MKTRFACSLISVLGVLALQPTAHASFHFMQIEQVIGSVNGDTTVQAIQLRMRSGGQNLVSFGKLVVFDAAGLNPITILDPTTNVPNGAVGDHVLIASSNFASHTTPPAMPDFIMTNLIPASYFGAGSLCWESDAGVIMWRLSWGGASYTGSNLGSTTNDLDGNFGPAFGSPLPSTGITAVQFPGPATALSTNNAADYLLTTGPVVFTNNAGTSFTVTGVLPTVTITAPDSNASEVPSTDVGKFRIARTGDTASDLQVFYAISGTATNRVDYQRLRNNAIIRAGRTFVAITLRPIDDTISESDETAILTLSPSPNYVIGSPSSATVTIHSNE
jgi:Calx-beta domain-containing protein